MTNGLDLKSLFAMIDNLLTGIGVFELSADHLKLLYLNEGGYRMFGYSQETGAKMFANMLSAIIEDDKKRFWQGIDDVLKDDGAVTFDFRTVTASGGLRWLSVRGNLFSKDEEKAILLCVIEDVTEQKFVESELQNQFSQYQELLQNDGILFDYNVKTDVFTLSKAHQYGFVDDVVIKDYSQFVETTDMFGDSAEQVRAMLNNARKAETTGTFLATFPIHKEESPRLFEVKYSSVTNPDGYVVRIVGWFTDVEDQKKKQEIKIASGETEISGLDNESGWAESAAAQKLIAEYVQNASKDEMSALMAVEMGNLKELCVTFNPDIAMQAAHKAMESISKLFRRHDILCKFDDTRCMLFLKNVGRISNVDILANKICNACAIQIEQDGQKGSLYCSIGIAIFPNHGDTMQSLILKAMDALDDAKRVEGSQFRIYDSTSTVIDAISQEDAHKINIDELMKSAYDLEDVCMRLLFEDSEHETSVRAILQLMTDHLGFQYSYLAFHDADDNNKEFWYMSKDSELLPNSEEDIKKWHTFLDSITTVEGLRVIHSYDPIPDELSGYLIAHGVHTLLLHPLMLNGKRAGVIVMGEVNGTEWDLDEEKQKDIRRIARLAQMVVMHFGKRISDRYNIFQLKMLDDFDSYVYSVNADTYELEFINHRILDEMQNVYVGQMCYKALHHRNKPCDNCILKKLNRDDLHATISDASFNMALRKWMKVNASWLDYKEVHPIALVNGVDISEYVSN